MIALSNIVTARYSPFVLFDGFLILPVGSVFAGFVFVLRDFVQLKHGRKKAYVTILCAMVISAFISIAVGDTAHIAVASTLSFLISETIDTEVFSYFKKSLVARVLLSGIVGGIADSAIFVVIGLSPIGTGALTWHQVPFAVVGQVLAKMVVQLAAAGVIARQTY